MTLAPYTRAQLGEARAAQALAVRARLLQAGITLPAWIDAYPGRLQHLIGDCAADPPLSQSARALALWHGKTLVLGLGALGLAAGGAALTLVAREAAVADELRRRLSEALMTTVRVERVPPTWPSRPAQVLALDPRRSWVVPAELLDRAGSALQGQPAHALITVAGAVARPQVVTLHPGQTPEELLRLCGGATTSAWVPLGGWPVRRCEPDQPLPPGESLLLVLPAGHSLVLRLRDAAPPAALTSGCAGCALCTQACPSADAALRPHLWMAGLAPRESTTACSGCGACDAVCPSGLLPGLWTQRAAAGLPPPRGSAFPKEASPSAPPIPLSLVTAAYGLSSYGG